MRTIVAPGVAVAALLVILALVQSNRARFAIVLAIVVPVGLFLAVYFAYFQIFPGD